MYMGSCGCKGGGGLQGLASGAGAAIGGAAGALFGAPGIGSAIGSMLDGSSGGGAGGGAAPSNVVYTSTNVNTQVSPQISPNFIQQQQPTNSAVNASTSQMLPSTPVTGAIPGIDTTRPYYPMQTSPGVDMRLVALGAVGIVLAVIIAKKRKKGGHVS